MKLYSVIKISEEEEKEDVEELKEVLDTISSFLKDLAPTIREMIKSVVGSLDGASLGEEAAEFYKSLIEAGMSREKAAELTEEFVKRKMAVIEVIPSIISKKVSRGPPEKEPEEKKED